MSSLCFDPEFGQFDEILPVIDAVCWLVNCGPEKLVRRTVLVPFTVSIPTSDFHVCNGHLNVSISLRLMTLKPVELNILDKHERFT